MLHYYLSAIHTIYTSETVIINIGRGAQSKWVGNPRPPHPLNKSLYTLYVQ